MKKEKNLYYKKVLNNYYNIYDSLEYGLNIAEFYTLDDLTKFINQITQSNHTKEYIRKAVERGQLIADRYEVIKDSIQYIDNLNTMEW